MSVHISKNTVGEGSVEKGFKPKLTRLSTVIKFSTHVIVESNSYYAVM